MIERMILKHLIAVLLFASFVCAGDADKAIGIAVTNDAPTQFKTLFSRMIEERADARKRLSDSIKSDESVLKNGKIPNQDKADIRNKLADKKSQLAELNNPGYIPKVRPSLTWTSTGLTCKQIEIDEIIVPGDAEVLQVVDDKTVRANLVSKQDGEYYPYYNCVITGIDTSKMIEKNIINIDQYCVTKKFSYVDVQSAKRDVISFTPIDINQYIRVVIASDKSGLKPEK